MELNENLTAERSIEIIRDSIEFNRKRIEKDSGSSLIWWGSLVFVFSLLIMYLWKYQGGPAWNFLWFVMWILGYVGEEILRKRRVLVPENFVGKTVGQVWGTFGIFCGSLGFILGLMASGIIPTTGLNLSLGGYINITSIITLCLGIACTIMGFILKNRIIQVCGYLAGIGGFFFALHFPGVEQLFVMAGAGVIGLIVPGLLINMISKK